MKENKTPPMKIQAEFLDPRKSKADQLLNEMCEEGALSSRIERQETIKKTIKEIKVNNKIEQFNTQHPIAEV